MRLALISGLAVLASPAIGQEPAPPKTCKESTTLAEAQKRKVAGARNLTDLPPAAAVRAVYRRVDGCAAPVVLKRGLGANPHLALPIEGEARIRLLDK